MVSSNSWYSCYYRDYDDLTLLGHSVYLFQEGCEPRSKSAGTLKEKFRRDVVFVEVAQLTDQDKLSGLKGDIKEVGSNVPCDLRSMEDLDRLLRVSVVDNIYLDASGLSVRVLAPLLKRCLEVSFARKIKGGIYVIYAEPWMYDVKRFSEEGEYFDLSEKIEGIKPLPGYERIFPLKDDAIVVPLLGFEGGRLAHILSNYRDVMQEAVPFVGVPGFRPEYPFVTYYGNRRVLQETSVYANVRYAAAGSIVDAFLKLVGLKEERHRVASFIVAPIGTKPHTIAALLFCNCFPKSVEIAYDNPIRNKVRTIGVGKLTVTCVSDLVRVYYGT